MLYFQIFGPKSSVIEGDVYFVRLPLHPLWAEFAMFSMFSMSMIVIAFINEESKMQVLNMHRFYFS